MRRVVVARLLNSTGVKIKNVPLRLKPRFLHLLDYGDEHPFDGQLIGASTQVAKDAQSPRLIRGKMPPQYRAWAEAADEEGKRDQEWVEQDEAKEED